MHRKHWDNFIEVARESLSISSYSEFGTWLHTKFTKFLPHEMMIFYWGDFHNSSSGHEVFLFKPNQEMVMLKTSETLSKATRMLYDKWLSNNSRWFLMNHADPLFTHMHFHCNPEFQALNCQSVLVYGVREMFGEGTCLYVFLGKEPVIEVDHYVIGMLMPYLDGAIKRIRGESENESIEDYISLTNRELEVMEWVNKGKTNYEIGAILSISHNTVKNHLKVIFKKLNVISRAQAVSKFSMHGRN